MPLTWHAQSFYRDSLARVERIIRTHPDYPGIYEAAAWVHFREARYKEAIDTAMEDLRRHPVEMACKVHQVVGMSLARLGRFDEAVASLEQAIEADPAYGKCYSRLGEIKAMTGQLDEAIGHYVRAIEIMPEYAPALIALGNLYRTAGETELAVPTFERVLEINSYDVSANLALGEMDIERENYAGAIERLEQLLDWMPENTVARTNLGVAWDARGREQAAIDAYATAIRRDPHAVVAIVNLANIHIRKNDLIEAQRVCEEALPQNAGALRLLIAYHDVVQRLGQPDRAVNAFERACRLAPADPDLQAWTAYALIHAGRLAEAASLPGSSPSGQTELAIPYLTRTLLALHRDDREAAIQHVDNLLAQDTSAAKDAMDRMLGDLEWFASTHPESPWPYFLSAKVLLRQNRGEFAELAVTEFLRLCPSEECRARAEALLR
ncbi:MAG: tetratricopeptide repeat protein [Planctomycetes bacterium]|nr:tetratricopeptide repeat protein [Planctomycetota bacterium]